jgi:hypothetical protein
MNPGFRYRYYCFKFAYSKWIDLQQSQKQQQEPARFNLMFPKGGKYINVEIRMQMQLNSDLRMFALKNRFYIIVCFNSFNNGKCIIWKFLVKFHLSVL